MNTKTTIIALTVVGIVFSLFIGSILLFIFHLSKQDSILFPSKKKDAVDTGKAPKPRGYSRPSDQAGEQSREASNQSSNSGAEKGARKDVDFGPYMAELQREIKHNWFPPKGNESKRVMVLFKVDKKGNISKLKLVKTSGVASADEAALKAVRDAAPFRALPEGAPSDVDIQFTFDYNVFKGRKPRGVFRRF